MSQGVTRRSALVAASVAVVGGVAGFIWGRNSDAKQAAKPGGGYDSGGYGGGDDHGGDDHGGDDNSGSGSSQPIVSLDKVPAGGGWIGNGLVVTRDSSGAVHAFQSACTHLGCEVNQVSGGRIFCPCHGSVFDANTGNVIQGPAGTPLPAVAVAEADGSVVLK